MVSVMRREAKILFMIAYLASLAGLVGCKDDSKKAEAVPTVGQYLHDIDKAKTMLVLIKNDPTKYATDPSALNAQMAIARKEGLLDCWPQRNGAFHVVTTAATDHACLDNKGYTR